MFLGCNMVTLRSETLLYMSTHQWIICLVDYGDVSDWADRGGGQRIGDDSFSPTSCHGKSRGFLENQHVLALLLRLFDTHFQSKAITNTEMFKK